LIHELGVHQIELDMQNEELRRQQVESDEAKNRYRALYDFAPLGYFTFDPDGRIAEVNLTGARLLGLPRSRLIGRSFSLFVEKDSLAQFHIHLQEVLASHVRQKNYEVEYRIRRHDGVYRHFLARGVPVLKDDGNIQEWVGACIDITERNQIEVVRKFLMLCGLPASGVDFFKSLARYLAENLGMDYVCVDRLQEEGLAARTVAIYFDGEFEDNLTYALKDTPCGDVVKNTICCFPKGVRHLYP